MKILIAADMEGISGVVHWDQVSSSHSEYARFRQIMTDDINAAVRGAYEAGASEVIVTDGHALGRNILIEALDRRARLNSGFSKPLAMVQGVDRGVNGAMFVGYHARVGTQHAILEHTWSSSRVANLLIQSEPCGEIGLNAAVCGHFDVPVILISGDQATCAEAQALIPGIETVEVKHANGRMAAELLPPLLAQEKIQVGARTAVSNLISSKASRPLKLIAPIRMAIDFLQSEMADNASLLPGSVRSGRRLEYSAADMISLYQAFQAAVELAL